MPIVAMTLGEIYAKRWQLRTHCKKCNTYQRVSVLAMIRVLGAEAVPWGRTPRCTVVSEGRWPCEGFVSYSCRTLRGASWRPMPAPSARDIEVWKYRRANETYNARRGWGPDGPGSETSDDERG